MATATNDLKGALADLNEAIRLNTRESGYYINRGLVRYQMNDLRGAMDDYDQVIGMDKNNLIARFNRGLLRYQVGDNNRAIEDFDVVIQQENSHFHGYSSGWPRSDPPKHLSDHLSDKAGSHGYHRTEHNRTTVLSKTSMW